MSGYIIYRGPSQLDGSPIVAVAITSSSNSKTGNMVQTHILVDTDEAPHKAQASGADVAICGDCPQRPKLGGSCYVVTAQGPNMVYQKLQRGGYVDMRDDLLALADMIEGRVVRLGTYGDPAAVPAYIWSVLINKAAGHTGYTHQWRAHVNLRELVMASADTLADAEKAQSMGWRTFRIRSADDPLMHRESVCPASEEGGRKLQCHTCQACNGATGRRGSIAIIAHGFRSRHSAQVSA